MYLMELPGQRTPLEVLTDLTDVLLSVVHIEFWPREAKKSAFEGFNCLNVNFIVNVLALKL
jgi:hypothetical protein